MMSSYAPNKGKRIQAAKMILQLLLLAFSSFTAKGQEWTQVTGYQGTPMHSVHANAKYLWALTTNNDSYFCERPCLPNKWIKVYCTQNVRTLDVGPYYAWLVINDGTVFLTTNIQDYKQVKSLRGIKDVAVGGNSYVWFLNQSNHIFKWSFATQDINFTDGTFYNIAANSEYIFAIDGNKVINFRPIDGNEDWLTIPGQFNYVTAGSHEIFAIRANDGQMYRCLLPCNGRWEEMESPSTGVVQLDVTIDALFAVTSGGNIYRHDLPL